MILPDVNVLVYALHSESPRHDVARNFLSRALVADEPVAFWDVSLISTYRVLTNPRVGTTLSDPQEVVEAINQLREAPASIDISSRPRLWENFVRVVQETEVRGPLASDAMLVALTIEHGGRLATFDQDFARFPGLDWFTPTA